MSAWDPLTLLVRRCSQPYSAFLSVYPAMFGPFSLASYQMLKVDELHHTTK